jgi:hypothetical protein
MIGNLSRLEAFLELDPAMEPIRGVRKLPSLFGTTGHPGYFEQITNEEQDLDIDFYCESLEAG